MRDIKTLTLPVFIPFRLGSDLIELTWQRGSSAQTLLRWSLTECRKEEISSSIWQPLVIVWCGLGGLKTSTEYSVATTVTHWATLMEAPMDWPNLVRCLSFEFHKDLVDLAMMEAFLDDLDYPMPYRSYLEVAHLGDTSRDGRLVPQKLLFKVDLAER